MSNCTRSTAPCHNGPVEVINIDFYIWLNTQACCDWWKGGMIQTMPRRLCSSGCFLLAFWVFFLFCNLLRKSLALTATLENTWFQAFSFTSINLFSKSKASSKFGSATPIRHRRRSVENGLRGRDGAEQPMQPKDRKRESERNGFVITYISGPPDLCDCVCVCVSQLTVEMVTHTGYSSCEKKNNQFIRGLGQQGVPCQWNCLISSLT